MSALMYESIRVKRQPGGRLTAKGLTEIGASLTDIDWRLLFWLLHYPLQRTDDLVVGVARWASRATVYRHVQSLETNGLVEGVLPKTPGTGKRLYHLSNPGLHLLARHVGKPARALARKWQADEAGLIRLLPRLPTLLVLQEVVNGLVTHATDAMTMQGKRPELVRWTWQRDLTHRFQYREHWVRFFADGVLSLCIHMQQSGGNVQELWYGAMFLCTELDDEQLMRMRLERLFYWRESPERWSCYQHMLPILMVASSPYQCDHWQRAIEASAIKLCLNPLAGAMAVVSSENMAHTNPWLYNWRTLATDVSCHLQEVLGPVPHDAFPSSIRLEVSDEEKYRTQSTSNGDARAISSGASARLSRLIVGDLTKRVAQITEGGLEEPKVVSLLGLHMTTCQRNVLYLLLEHPLLSDEELAALLGLLRKSMRCALYELHQLGCLETIVTEAGKRWHLCERGLRQIAAANHLHIRNIAAVPDHETGMEMPGRTQPGVAWILQHIQHTAGIYSFFARVALAARRKVGHELCWWESGGKCEQRYRVGEQWYNFRPDALAEYRVGAQHLRFWLEWDRGTMNVRDLAIKFTSYRHYISSRQWAREHSRLPFLICVAPDIAQERRMQRVAQDRLMSSPGLMVWTTTKVLLDEHGPLARIWLQGMPQVSQVVQPIGSTRQCVFTFSGERT